MKSRSLYKIIIAGEGGQGVQTLAHAVAISAFKNNLHVSYMPNYGVEQRGGVSLGFLQFGKDVIGFPKFETADILIIMCKRAVKRVGQYVGDNTLIIYDSSQISSFDLADIRAEKLPIPATELATSKLTTKVFNMVLAGAMIAEVSSISRADLEKSFESIFAEKYKAKPQLRHLNKRALVLGERVSKEVYQTIK